MDLATLNPSAELTVAELTVTVELYVLV